MGASRIKWDTMKKEVRPKKRDVHVRLDEILAIELARRAEKAKRSVSAQAAFEIEQRLMEMQVVA
jgi:hypothetical protein